MLAVDEDVEVLVDVLDGSLGAEGAHADGLEPVGQVVEAGIPRRVAGLEPDQLRLVRRLTCDAVGALVVAARELERQHDREDGDHAARGKGA